MGTSRNERERSATAAPGARRKVAGIVLEAACWWIACTAVWLATLGTITKAELVVAAGAGLPCAVLACASRRAMRLRARIPARVWRWAFLVPVTAVTDLVRVAGWAVRATSGRGRSSRIVSRALPPGESAPATGWRATAAVAVSATPGTLVLDVDPDSGVALMHAIVRSTPALDARVAVRTDGHGGSDA